MKHRESVTTNGRAVFYAALWNDLRQAAMDKGWALALHGSLASDMDIMAMPWTEEATTDIEMIEALKKCFTDADCIGLKASDMPNNRRVFTLSIWADFYLDINIIKPNVATTTPLSSSSGEALKDNNNSVEQEDIYDSIYMEVVQLVEKDNIQCEAYKATAEKLKSQFIIKRKQ
jgi:hypothetical protein